MLDLLKVGKSYRIHLGTGAAHDIRITQIAPLSFYSHALKGKKTFQWYYTDLAQDVNPVEEL